VRGAGQRTLDRRDHVIDPKENLIVPESQHSPASTFKPSRSSRIAHLLNGVLPAIQLDDETSLDTCEVGEEWTDCMLPPEFAASNPAVTQMPPEFLLGIGRCTAQIARTRRFTLDQGLPSKR